MKSKTFLLLCLIIVIPAFISAQHNHFIYLQTESRQPFYVKIEKKILSSSLSGYLIIPKLPDGTYNIIIGFPKSQAGEQTYTCIINKRDAGYLIKDFGDKGWGLFNLQNMDVVMANNTQATIAKTAATKTDDFSAMLSEVVNDPSIRQTETKTPASVSVPPSNVEVKESLSVNTFSSPGIIKTKYNITDAGIEAVYVDVTGDIKDTINILIPVNTGSETNLQPGEKKVPPVVFENPVSASNETNKEIKTATTSPVDNGRDNKKGTPEFLPVEVNTEQKSDPVSVRSSTAMVNSDCKEFATPEDFMKVRKKMAAEKTDDAMISAAQRFFRIKCYTTEQVKNLSVLFLTDAGKYHFFDVVYPFVSDTGSFPLLETQLSDSYYITRFKAMVRH